MRRSRTIWIAALLAMVLIGSCTAAQPTSAGRLLPEQPRLTARAAVLLDQASGQLLYSKDPDALAYPASLTKLLSVLVVVRYAGDLDQSVTVGWELSQVQPNSSVAGLRLGDRLSLRDLLYGMLLPSGNDAAYVAAVYTGRQQQGNPDLGTDAALAAFISLMNSEAGRLGADHSHFVNPDGYHNPDHYSTAHDLALISRAAMQQPELRQIVAQASWSPTVLRQGNPVQLHWSSSNRLLYPGDPTYYPAATGLKTGTTPEAGHCLAASASIDQLELIAIVLDSDANGRWQDAHKLLDYGFREYRYQLLCQANEPQLTVRVASRWPGFYAQGKLLSTAAVAAAVPTASADQVTHQIEWATAAVARQSEPVTLAAGVAPGAAVGRLVFRLPSRVLAEVPLTLGPDRLRYRPGTTVLLALVGLGLAGGLAWRRRRDPRR